jgi:hypothetical protein
LCGDVPAGHGRLPDYQRKGHRQAVLLETQERLDDKVKNLGQQESGTAGVRAFLLSTLEENNKLRARLDMFKKALEE